MIVCRKPLTLYDVDLVGAAIVIALCAATWWIVLRPWQGTWQSYRELAAKRAAAESTLQEDIVALERFEEELARLEHVVASEAGEVPRADSLPRILSQMTDVAEDAQVELLTVVPQPAAREAAYLVSDVQVSGRASSHDFMRFLDRLAQENPYQSLQACSISQSGGGQAACDLSWTLRVYHLPLNDQPQDSGGRP